MLVKELIKTLNYEVLQDFEIHLGINYNELFKTIIWDIDYTDKIVTIISGMK